MQLTAVDFAITSAMTSTPSLRAPRSLTAAADLLAR
jgi:hypothetical protein